MRSEIARDAGMTNVMSSRWMIMECNDGQVREYVDGAARGITPCS